MAEKCELELTEGGVSMGASLVDSPLYEEVSKRADSKPQYPSGEPQYLNYRLSPAENFYSRPVEYPAEKAFNSDRPEPQCPSEGTAGYSTIQVAVNNSNSMYTELAVKLEMVVKARGQ